jgi:hypothetical protein
VSELRALNMSSLLNREVLKWIQSLDLAYSVKKPKRLYYKYPQMPDAFFSAEILQMDSWLQRYLADIIILTLRLYFFAGICINVCVIDAFVR